MPQTEDFADADAVRGGDAERASVGYAQRRAQRGSGPRRVSPPRLAIPPAPRPPVVAAFLPAPALPLRATPNKNTAQAVTDASAPSLQATPSAVTALTPSGPLSPLGAWLLVVCSHRAGRGADCPLCAAWAGRQSAMGRSPDVRGPGPLDPQPGIATSQPAGGASALAAQPALRAAESAARAQVTASASHSSPLGTGQGHTHHKTSSKSSATRCPMPTFTAACIRGHGQAQSAEVRAAVLDAAQAAPAPLVGTARHWHGCQWRARAETRPAFRCRPAGLLVNVARLFGCHAHSGRIEIPMPPIAITSPSVYPLLLGCSSLLLSCFQHIEGLEKKLMSCKCTNKHKTADQAPLAADRSAVGTDQLQNEKVRRILQACEASGDSGECSAKAVDGALEFLDSQPYVTVYLRPEHPLPSLIKMRRGQLVELVKPLYLFPTTRFLIIAQPAARFSSLIRKRGGSARRGEPVPALRPGCPPIVP